MFIPVDGMFPSLIGRGYTKACRRLTKYLGLSRTSPQFWYGVLREDSNKHLPGMIKWLMSFRQDINKQIALSIQAMRYFSRWSTSHWKWWGIWFIIFTGISYIFIPVSLCLNMWVSFCDHRFETILLFVIFQLCGSQPFGWATSLDVWGCCISLHRELWRVFCPQNHPPFFLGRSSSVETTSADLTL